MSDAIEVHLANQPADAAMALVLADQLQEQGDLRGELIALQCRLATAAAEEIPALDEACAAYTEGHWSALVGRSGGFPWRPRWAGRNYVGYRYDRGPQQVRVRARGVALYDRIVGAMESLTEVSGPSWAHLPLREPSPGAVAGRYEVLNRTGRLTSEAAADPSWRWLAALHRALGPGRWRRFEWHRTQLPGHGCDPSALRAVVASKPDAAGALSLMWAGAWTFPGTDHPLPFQDRRHYAGEPPSPFQLRLELDTGAFELELALPFEDFEHVGLSPIVAGLEGALGRRALARRGWLLAFPNRAGSKLRTRRVAWRPTDA